MTSFIFICLWSLSMVTTISSKLKDKFELEINQYSGIQMCKKHCEDKIACVDVNYFHTTLGCVLQINSFSKPRGDIGYCVQCSVRARSGRIVTVCELIGDIPPPADKITNDENKLSFIPVGKDPCKISGKQCNILEPKPGLLLQSKCKARIDKPFLSKVKYSWTLCVKETNFLVSNVFFKFTTTYNSKIILHFILSNSEGILYFKSKMPRRIKCKVSRMLKVSLHNGILDVIDGKTHFKVMRQPFGSKTGHKLHLFVRIHGSTLSDLKVIITREEEGCMVEQ